jgi:hypothetical protein
MRIPSRRGRTLRWVAIAAGGVSAAALVLHALSPAPFPDQLPHSHSDVSLRRALRDHGIILPRSTRNLRYSANHYTEDDDYALAAEFTLACAEIPALVGLNDLAQVSHWYQLLDIGAYDLAENLGANPDSPTDTWYERVDNPRNNLSAMIQPGPRDCQAYLIADRTTDAHDASPLGG